MKGAGSKLWIYDTDNKVWVPLAGTSEGAMSIHAIVESLDDIEDVNVPTPGDNEALTWDAATSKWIPEAPVPAAHKDTHDPQDGSDPLDTAAPVKVGSANAVGTSHSLARADHVHEREHAIYTDAAAKAAAVQAGAITDAVTKAPTHDAVYDVKATADAAMPSADDAAAAVAAMGAEGDANPLNHAKYTDAEAKAQAEGAKLDAHAAPDDTTTNDATAALHGLMPKVDKGKVDGISAGHEALTTGVHGVGAGYVAETSVENLDLASHEARHQVLGSDRLKILLNLLNATICLTDWTTRDAWTDYITGTGAVTWQAILDMLVSSGATTASIGSLYTGPMGAFSPLSTDYPWGARIQMMTAATTAEAWVVARKYGVTPASFPSLTEAHIGWRLLNGDLFASNGDGTNGTQTDTGIDLSQYVTAELLIVGTGGTSIAFYVDRVLKATHTTNLPTEWTYFCWLGIKNSNGVARIMRIIKTAWGLEA